MLPNFDKKFNVVLYVEDNQEPVCHVPSAPADVQGTTPSNNAQPHLSDSCNTSVSLASPSSETPPEPKGP